MKSRIISFIVLACLCFACATVPVTGRKQLSLVPNEEIIAQSAVEYKKVLAQSKLSSNQEQVAMIRSVGSRIEKAVESYMAQKGLSAELNGFAWEFNLIEDDKTANAWCMPGGKVAFYTGILPICKDETGVAIVMGHEVAHAIANHGRERMSEAMLANGLLGSLSSAMGQNPSLTQQLLLQSLGIGAQVGMLKFSRENESEADHIGLIFMSMAGYDPREAPKFWERMQSMSGGGAPPEWLSTHPSHTTRIRDLEKWIPEAESYKKQMP
ncbi:MAG TPA: M48 family metallopeptidase, partial [Anaerolineales bacterium]|nr:M48 family metallopeptidase [Anaerolineales bacterium]